MKQNHNNDTDQTVSANNESGAIHMSTLSLAEIFDHFEDAVIVADINRYIIYVNTATEQLFGYTKATLYGQKTQLLYAHQHDFIEQGRKYFNIGSKIVAKNYRVLYQRQDGEQFLGMTTGARMHAADGRVLGFMGVIRPARSADHSLDTLQKINSITADIILTHDQKIQHLLGVGLNHFGLEIAIVSSIRGNDYTVEHCVDFHGKLEPRAKFDLQGTYCVHTLIANQTVGFHFVGESEIQNHPCYKNFKLESYIGTPIRLSEEVYGTVNFSSTLPVEAFCKDDYILMGLLSDTFSYLLYKKKSEEELVAMAKTDELTGLLNRRATLERLGVLLELSYRSGDNLCILSIDIDHFKSINDQWGHSSGDLALIQFARVASSLIRKTDFCGRIGGEEFVFVLPLATLKAGQEFGNRLRQQLAVSPFVLDNGKSITLSVSAGVAMLNGIESIESLLARADAAMYKAKNQGRDRVCI